MAQSTTTILQQLTALQPSRQPGGAAAFVEKVMQIANQFGTVAVTVVALPMQQEIKKLGYVLWQRMVYEHLVWMSKVQMNGIDEAYVDARDRVFALQSSAPDIRKAFITIFSTAGLHAARAYRKALRSQIPDNFWWVVPSSATNQP